MSQRSRTLLFFTRVLPIAVLIGLLMLAIAYFGPYGHLLGFGSTSLK